MKQSTPPQATILIASDSSADARLVKTLLIPEFDHLVISTDIDRPVEDVELHTPSVLVLAFDSVAKSEQFCLGLHRHNERRNRQYLRIIILCHKHEVQRAYEMCRKELFDDYVLFWPMTLEAPRLPMAIHIALRELAADFNSRLFPGAESMGLADQLAELQSLLEQKTKEDHVHIATVDRVVTRAEQGIGAALDRIAQQLTLARVGDIHNRNVIAELGHELALLRNGKLHQHFEEIVDAIQPLKNWSKKIQKMLLLLSPDSPRAHRALDNSRQATILVVDDDEFLRKMVGKILQEENYQLVFAASGLEALSILQTTVPDLILMDIMMPGLTGIETLRQIKALPQLTNVPVVMLTGNSEGVVVVESIKEGARDFVVKPFDRNKLITKIAGLI